MRRTRGMDMATSHGTPCPTNAATSISTGCRLSFLRLGRGGLRVGAKQGRAERLDAVIADLVGKLLKLHTRLRANDRHGVDRLDRTDHERVFQPCGRGGIRSELKQGKHITRPALAVGQGAAIWGLYGFFRHVGVFRLGDQEMRLRARAVNVMVCVTSVSD